MCDRESLKPKSAEGSVRAVLRARGIISAEDDAAYEERQVTFRAKMSRVQTLRSTDARTRKIDQERRGTRKSGGGFTRASVRMETAKPVNVVRPTKGGYTSAIVLRQRDGRQGYTWSK